MKRYFNIKNTAVALITLLLSGCNDWLDIIPRDIVTEDNFWNEKADIKQCVAGVYTAMQSEDFISRCILWGEGRSDNLYPSGSLTEGDFYEVMRENLLSTNAFTNWSKFYYVINQCSVIIEMAPVVCQRDPSYRTSEVLATQAEMTALRSLCYFYLIRAFDQVPFTRVGIQSEDKVEYQPASSFEYVLNEIISDLESVKENALVHYPSSSIDGPGKTYWSNCNRITRTAIEAMLADMYLWAGNYDKSIENAEAVIAQKRADYIEFYSSRFGIVGDGPQEVQGLFDRVVPLFVATPSNPSAVDEAVFGVGNSFESIFELSFNYASGVPYVGSYALARIFGSGSSSINNKGTGTLVVNPAIVSDLNTGTFKYFDHQYDARFYNALEAVDENYGGGSVRKGVASKYNLSSSSVSSKIAYNNSSSSAFGLSSEPDRNWIFYRLTDVMLIEAESYAMKASEAMNAGAEPEVYSHWLEEAFDLVYVINKRSTTYSTNYLRTSNSALSSPGAAIQLIRAERERELIFEGKRWFDLLRQARRDGNPSLIKSLVTSKLSGAGNKGSFPSIDALFWPYNKQELKVNPYLKQKSIYASESSDEYEMK